MTRDGIAAEAKKAGLTNVVLPGGDVAGKPINTGQRARWFAGYMRIQDDRGRERPRRRDDVHRPPGRGRGSALAA